MLSKSDTLQFKLKVQKGNSLVVLSNDNKANLLLMANNLLTSIDINYRKTLHEVYVNEVIGGAIQTCLHSFFTQTRNGYFRKDNVYTFAEIEKIREHAYCAFFLLGSAFLFTIESFESASQNSASTRNQVISDS